MQLRRADVVAGALALLDSEGLEGLTMRKLAAHLGVRAGGLYWHFANKQALLDAMADKLIDGVADPLPPGPWDERLTALARRLRLALLARRDGARVLAGTNTSEANSVAAGRTAIAILCEAGLSVERAGWIAFSLMYYVLGHTIEEQAQVAGAWKAVALPEQDDGDTRAFTALAAVLDADPAERFDYGLAVFLDGVRHQLPQ